MKKQKIRLLSLFSAFTISSSVFAGATTLPDKKIQEGLIRQAFLEQLKEKGTEFDNAKYNEALKKLGIKEIGEKDGEVNKQDFNEKIRVIVQLKEGAAVKSGANEQQVKNGQANLITKVEALIGTKVIKSFGYLVNGFSVEVKRGDIEKLKALDGVRSVTEARVYYPDMNYASKISKAYNTWKDYGYKGEGLVVSIIDTGIDYRHKDLQSIDKDKIKVHENEAKTKSDELKYGKYFSDKIPYGYNYADGNDDIIDKGSQHGMHVAGIVAANGNDEDVNSYKAIKGVAPEAQLLAMKVFSNNTKLKGAYDDDIIAAIEDSVKLGADVINMSLGSEAGFMDSEDPQQVAVKNATDKGVLCVISAGNSQTSTSNDDWSQPLNMVGLKDTSMVGSPSVSEDSLSVASMENDNIAYKGIRYTGIKGSTKLIPFGKGTEASLDVFNKDNDIVNCATGSADDFQGKDLTGKIALIKRGGITFEEKANNAAKSGAIGAILYNHEAGGDLPIAASFGEATIPCFTLGCSDGKAVINLINAGENKIKFNITGEFLGKENPDINDMSQFTSWGTTPSLDFKPEITAPGGDINSLANNNDYQNMSGTSMSAPYTAGGEAIILQSLKAKGLEFTGKELAAFIKSTAMNTAVPMKDKYNNGTSYSPRRQGAGLLQIDKAVNNEVIVTNADGKPSVALREIGKSTTFNLKLKNYSDKENKYILDKEAILSETVNNENGHISSVEVKGSTLSFDKTQVVVPAKGEATVTVNLQLSDELEMDNFVEGYIKLNSQNSDEPNLSIPYMGFYGDWSKEQIIDSPLYKEDKTIFGQTGLKISYNGASTGMAANEEVAAISPNGDDLYESAKPVLYLLRNAKKLEVEILDKDKKVIRTVDRENNVRKNSYGEFAKKEKLNTELNLASWDGTVYDDATGKYNKVPDGQYYYRIKTKVDLKNAKEQILEMSIKVDTVAPKVEVLGIFKTIEGKYLLKWKAKDDYSGIGMSLAFVNGEKTIFENPTVESEGIYSAEIKNVVENGVNLVDLGVRDNAGNVSTSSDSYKVGTIDNVSFVNLKDGEFKSEKALVDGKINLFAAVSDSVHDITINGEQINIVNKYLNYSFAPKVGANTIEVKARDKDEKEIYNKTYKFVYDNICPEITVTEPVLSEKDINYTGSKQLTIKGSVKDTNLEKLSLVDELGKLISEVDVKEDGSFSVTKDLVNNLEVLKLKAVDKAFNVTEKTYKLSEKKVEEPFEIVFENLGASQFISGVAAPKDIYTIKGKLTQAPQEFKIAGQEVKLNDDLTFTKDISLVQGTNRISVYAKEKSGKVFENSYKIIFDSKLPTIKIEGITRKADGNAYVNTDTITLKGKVSDNLYGYRLMINGEAIFNLDRYPSQDPNVLTKDFEKTISLKQAETKVQIEVVDQLGNKTVDDLNIVLDKVAPEKTSIKLSENKLTNKPVQVTLVSNETKLEKLEYSFDNKVYTEYKEPITVNAATKVYARATDFAGNVSEVSETDVNIDTVSPVIMVKGVEEAAVYTTKITPEVTVDDKDATVEVKLNGTNYDVKAIELAGDYELEAKATDKAGNVTISKIKFTVKQSATTKVDGDNTVIELGEIKSSYDNIVVSAKDATNVKVNVDNAKLTKENKAITINTKDVNVEIPTSIISDENIKTTTVSKEEVKPWENANRGLKFLGKIYEFEVKATLKDGSEKLISKFGDNRVKLSFKLTEEEVKSLDTSKLVPLYYDETNKEWTQIGNGKFDKYTLRYTFEVSHFSKYALGVKEETAGKSVDGRPTSNGTNETVKNTINDKNTDSADVSTNQNNGAVEQNKATKLEKTGSPINTKAIVLTGMGLLVLGSLALVYSKKRTIKVSEKK